MKVLFLYLLTMNALGLLVMLADKRRAQKNRWRIPEATLMTIAALGGSLGSLLGMQLFRHKTRHRKFTLGIPAILLAQIALALFLLTRG